MCNVFAIVFLESYISWGSSRNVSADFILKAYCVLFHSHITYGLIFWGHAADSRKILVQKKAVRLMSSAGLVDHWRNIFFRLDSFVYVKDNIGYFPLECGTSKQY